MCWILSDWLVKYGKTVKKLKMKRKSEISKKKKGKEWEITEVRKRELYHGRQQIFFFKMSTLISAIPTLRFRKK